MKQYILLFCIIFVFYKPITAQTNAEPVFSGCGSDELLQRNASLSFDQHSLDTKLYEYMVSRQKQRSPSAIVDYIPVVVHIIHNGGPENIPNSQVLAAISDINSKFLESEGRQIQFCLAQRDPNGNATTGITRDVSALTNETMETDDIALKNIDRWAPTCYLNIWVVAGINSISMGSGVIGYAYFPSSHGMPEDGVVIEAGFFGSSPMNDAVGAHEIGHYLGLYHTFQNACPNNNCLLDGDQVCDTPPDQTTFASCSPASNSCNTDPDDPSINNPFTTDVTDLGNDYMDYSSLSCYNMFTTGQYERMDYFLDNIRHSLLTCLSCTPPCPATLSASITLPASSVTITTGGSVNFAGTYTSGIGEQWYLIPSGILGTSSTYTHVFPMQGIYWMKYKAVSGDPTMCLDAIDSVQIIVLDSVSTSCEGSLQFTNTNSSVHLPATTDVYSSNGFTWECWVKLIDPFGTDWRPMICAIDEVVYEDIALSFGWTGGVGNVPVTGLAFKVDGPGGPSSSTCYYTPPGGFVLNTWYHVAGSMDYVTQTGKLYLNGALVDTKLITSTPFSRIIPPQLSWDVALNPHYPGPPLGGNMDEVRIWKTVRTDAEIAANYNQCLSGTETDLLMYYRANQTSGTACLDATPAGYNGMLSAPTLWATDQPSVITTNCAGLCNSFCPMLSAGIDTVICDGGSIQLDASGGYTNYHWSPATGLSDPAIANPIASPAITTTYVVTGTNLDSSLVVNGDFALGNYGFTSGQTFTTTYSPCDYYVAPTFFTTSYPFTDHTSTTDNYFMSVDGCTTGPTVLWEQLIPAITAGADYEFSFWATRADAIQPDFEIHAIGDVTGDIIVATQPGIPYAGTAMWDQYGLPVWNAGPNSSVTFRVVNLETNGYGNDFGMDDFSLRRTCVKTDSVTVSVGSTSVNVDLGNDTTLCGSGVIVIDAGPGLGQYNWQDGSHGQTYTAFGPGTYWVTVISPCGSSDTDTITVSASPSPAVTIMSDSTVCAGDSIQLGYTGSAVFSNFNWEPGTYLSCNNCPHPMAAPVASGVYYLVANTAEGCGAIDSVYLTVFPNPSSALEIAVTEEMCGNGAGSVQLNITDNSAAPYLFNFNGAGYSSVLAYPDLVSGNYDLEVINSKGCVYDTLIHVPDNGMLSDTSLVPNCFSPNNDGQNDTWSIPSFCGEKITCKILNRWGMEVAHLGDGQKWNGKIKDQTAASDGIYYYIAEIEYLSGQKKTLKGFINLLR